MILEKILGSKNVYFNPPMSVKIKYPCIIYALEDINTIKADNISYKTTRAYQITTISKDPDNDIGTDLLELEKCTFQRRFTSDNLVHDVFRLYF